MLFLGMILCLWIVKFSDLVRPAVVVVVLVVVTALVVAVVVMVVVVAALVVGVAIIVVSWDEPRLTDSSICEWWGWQCRGGCRCSGGGGGGGGGGRFSNCGSGILSPRMIISL